jgi:hypothetical protein
MSRLVRRTWIRAGARGIVAVTALLGGAVLLAGCGGGKPPASVASLGTTTPASSGAQSGTSGGLSGGLPPAGPGGSGGELKMVGGNVQSMARFSACMRSNGEPNFPDPNAQGAISISAAAGIDPGSAQFQRAQQACQKELPNGGQPTPAQLAQMRQSALAFSACMRKNGVANFPDPQFGTDGGVSIHIGPGDGIDPRTPQFQHAQQACRRDLPFGRNLPTSRAAAKTGGAP